MVPRQLETLLEYKNIQRKDSLNMAFNHRFLENPASVHMLLPLLFLHQKGEGTAMGGSFTGTGGSFTTSNFNTHHPFTCPLLSFSSRLGLRHYFISQRPTNGHCQIKGNPSELESLVNNRKPEL